MQAADGDALRQALAVQVAAQDDGPPLWRDLHVFGAEAMLGFDGHGQVLLRMRAQGARQAQVVALAPDDARSLADALNAAATCVEPMLASGLRHA